MKKLIIILALICSAIITYGQNSAWPYDEVDPTSTDTLLVWHQDSTKVITMSEFVWANGLNPLTANWDIGAYILTGLRFVSDVATGTAPFTVASTTVVSNLNSDLLDGQEGSYYMDNATHTGEVTGSGALTIADDIIEAANLEATNSPTDNYLPSYDAATGGFTWVSQASGSGTGDMLSANNLSDVDNVSTARTNLSVYSQAEVASLVSDSLDALLEAGETAVALADSGVYDGGYITPTMLDTELDGFDGMDYDTIDYLVAQIASMRSEIDDLITAVEGVGVDITPPRFESAELGTYNDSIIMMVMDNSDIHQDSVPPTTAFTLTENGTTFGIEAVSISDDTVFIALDSAGIEGAAYLVDYTRSYPYLQDSSYNSTANWTDNTVTNNLAVLPYFASAELGTYHDTVLLVLMSEAMDEDSIPLVGAFNLTAGTSTIGLNSLSINDDSLFIGLDSALTIYEDSTFLVDYTPGWPRLRDANNNAAAAWVDSSVTNNLGAENMITNGTFDTDTDWTKETEWTISAGAANYDDSSSGYMSQASGDMVSPTQASTSYTITFTISGLTSGTAELTLLYSH